MNYQVDPRSYITRSGLTKITRLIRLKKKKDDVMEDWPKLLSSPLPLYEAYIA
jgi:hypothetical protein